MNYTTFKNGSVIFREGDEENWMYDIFDGNVDVYVGYGTPEEKKLTTLIEGELFGELGLVEQKPRSATAVAVGSVKLKKITEEDFAQYVEEQPVKVLRIMQQTSQRMRDLSRDYVKVAGAIADYLKAEEAGKKVPSEIVDNMKTLLAKVK